MTRLSRKVTTETTQIKQQSLESSTQGFQLQYSHSHGQLYQGNLIDWLKSLESESIDLIFADPPYNIKKADWDNFENQEKYVEWSIKWISESSRILKSTGSLYICGFSEILADLKYSASKYFKRCRWLIWHYKNKANLGSDWGRSHESILYLRKSDVPMNHMRTQL
jgi:site-specific DNA-methyltransferase (adenine-specific)